MTIEPVDPRCQGKIPFRNRGAALMSIRARQMGRRVRGRMNGKLEPYQCGSCSLWHLGTCS